MEHGWQDRQHQKDLVHELARKNGTQISPGAATRIESAFLFIAEFQPALKLDPVDLVEVFQLPADLGIIDM